jgi:hypothetical protein
VCVHALFAVAVTSERGKPAQRARLLAEPLTACGEVSIGLFSRQE